MTPDRLVHCPHCDVPVQYTRAIRFGWEGRCEANGCTVANNDYATEDICHACNRLYQPDDPDDLPLCGDPKCHEEWVNSYKKEVHNP